MVLLVLLIGAAFFAYVSSKLTPTDSNQDHFDYWGPNCRLWNFTYESVNQAWTTIRDESGAEIGRKQLNIDPDYECAKCPEGKSLYECETYCNDSLGSINLTQRGAELFTIISFQFAEQLAKKIVFPEMKISLGIAEIKIKDLTLDQFKVRKVSFQFSNTETATAGANLPYARIDDASLALSGEFSLKVPFLQVLVNGRLDISISELNLEASVGIYINNNKELEWDEGIDTFSCPYHISFGAASTSIVLGNLSASLTGEGMGALNMIIQSLLSSLKDMLNKILGSALVSSIFSVAGNALSDDTIAKPHKVPAPHNHVMYDQRFTYVTVSTSNILIKYSGVVYDNGLYGSHLDTMYRSRLMEHDYDNEKNTNKNIVLFKSPSPADMAYVWHYEILNSMFYTFFNKGIHEYDTDEQADEIFSYSADIIYRKSMLDIYDINEQDADDLFKAKYIVNQAISLPIGFVQNHNINDSTTIKYHLNAVKPPVVDKVGANGILVVAEGAQLSVSGYDIETHDYYDIVRFETDIRFSLKPGYTLERWDSASLTNMNATMIWFNHEFYSVQNTKVDETFGAGQQGDVKIANEDLLRKVIKMLLSKIVGPKLYRMSRCDKFASFRLENIPMIKTFPESDVTEETINAKKLKFCAKSPTDVWSKDYIPQERRDTVEISLRHPMILLEASIDKSVSTYKASADMQLRQDSPIVQTFLNDFEHRINNIINEEKSKGKL